MLEIVCCGLFIAVLVWLVSRQSRLRLRVRLELLTALLAVLMAGLYVVAKRFETGLGGVTNLSDRFPWGIWIGFDLCGIALAAGGFVLAATVHIFRVRRFEPIVRPVILTSFLAYLLVAAILVLDLGRPYRFWHPLIMWQPHSVMFEITLCITFYSLVLAIELSPALFERLGWRRLASLVHEIALPLVLVGVILSTLHQSSFGSLFLIVPQKLHVLWYTPILPALFLMSAVCAGIAVVIVESHLCARFLHKHLPRHLMVELGRVCSQAVWIYAIAKVADLWVRGAWGDLASHAWLGLSWGVEVIGGAVVPAIWLMRMPREHPRGLIVSASLVIGGVALNRLNVSWFGLLPYTGLVYAPSWMEIVSTAALALAGVLAFLGLSSFLPVFEESPRQPVGAVG
jgi:Ni/Fe-hydrogenase subunit HybB-like protein